MSFYMPTCWIVTGPGLHTHTLLLRLVVELLCCIKFNKGEGGHWNVNYNGPYSFINMISQSMAKIG